MSFCGLCKQEAELKDSHLIPKSLYRSMKKSFPTSNNQRIVFGREDNNTSSYSDYQVKRPFLCGACEQKLNKHGENIICPECYRGPNKFPLLQKIENIKLSEDVQEDIWINPQEHSNLDSNAYLYFASSILWRASAGDWPHGLSSYKNALGSRYQEEIRLYLLGKSKFPENIYLAVYVDSDTDIYPLILFPQVKKKIGYHHHVFYIPGIKFSFIIGADIKKNVKSMYLEAKTKIFFMKYSFKKHPDFQRIHRTIKHELNPKGRLKNDLEKKIDTLEII